MKERLEAAGLTVNLEKSQFCRSSLRYLGFVVDELGLRRDPEKITAVLDYPAPQNSTELRRFLGMCSWYRRFIHNFSTLCAPLNELMSGQGRTKKFKIKWEEKHEKAFRELKECLVRVPILSCPNFEEPFVIQTDASDVGLGAVLSQGENENERVIAYASRSLSRTERKYSATEKECLAVVFAVEKFRSYIEGTKFKVITDHYSLLWLNRLKDPHGKLARWAVRLQQFTFDLVHRKGKDHVVPDALSRATHIELISFDTNETQDRWYLRMKENVESNPENYPEWNIREDKLFKRIEERFCYSDPDFFWKMVVPKSQRHKVYVENHDDPTASHPGVYKTLKRIRQKYYWPGMKSDIVRYVRRCEYCLGSKAVQTNKAGYMGKQRDVSRPWQMISTDLIGKYPRSRKGNTYVLVVCDWFTKFTLLFPLRAATSKAISRIIKEEVFLLYGVPEIIVCDNGPQYTSKEFQELLKRYKVPKLWYNARYHPQVNPAERVNRVVTTAIRSLLRGSHKDWDKHLSHIGCALRTANHEVTGYTPAFLNFGREIILSGNDYNSAVKEDGLLVFDRGEKSLVPDEQKDLFKQVRDRLAKSYERNRYHYNLRRRPAELHIGQIVWKRNTTLSNAAKDYCAKFAPKYVKCVVSAKHSPLVYSLRSPDGQNLGRWHIQDLKVSFTEEEERRDN